ncbi:MAG TPA: diguanylate cyclase, partial [Quisquiliibacterium sp.]|nr:diguanylate cyclase [Quisquiliibacterium sp.]
MNPLPASASTTARPRLPGAVARLAVAWGVVVALSLPLLFLAVGYQSEVVRLDTALQVGVRASATAAASRRSGTGLDQRAAQTLLATLAAPGDETTIRITDASGRALAAVDGDGRSPMVLRSSAVFPGEQGSPQVEMARSLRPLLTHSLLILLPGLLLGLVAAVGLKDVPMRAFRLALSEAAVRKEAEERLAKSLSVFAATLESTADGILVTDVLGRAVVSNQRFAQLWNEPRRTAAGAVDPEAMFAIATRLRDPASFLETQKDLTRHIGVDHGAVLELLDGRLFEWNSRPQFIDGKVVGRVSSFRDISERKRAEALLSAEKEVLEMVVCGTPLTTALGVLARRLEMLSGHMFCAILFRESHDEDTLSLATGPNLPRPFAEAIVCEEQTTLCEVFADVGTLDGHDGDEGPDPHSPVIEETRGRPAWDQYHARVSSLDIEVGCTVSVRSAAGRLMGLVIAHYRPGTDLPRSDRDLIRVASHLTRIAIERRQAEAQLRFLAHYDALTYLPNRDLFRDRLTQALSQAARRGDCVAVMFLDLDRFKTINDTLGHDAGDLLLCEVSERLRRCVREEDTVARLGGDEFTVIMHQIRRPDDAGVVAGKIVEALASPIYLNGRETFATPSIGIAVYPSDGTSAESLIKHADTAMYRAKKDGGNGYCFFDAAMNIVAEDRLELESGLRRALEREEFVVHYQPKLCLATGAIVSAEALLRWRHPERGLVGPGEFIPILEETGLIEAVGEWVLKAVCSQIRAWQDEGLAPLTVAV